MKASGEAGAGIICFDSIVLLQIIEKILFHAQRAAAMRESQTVGGARIQVSHNYRWSILATLDYRGVFPFHFFREDTV
jgi:hypothetical protein